MTKLVLIVPLGVDKNIFPWGVHVIKNYLKGSLPRANVDIWDLNHDGDVQEIVQKNSGVIEKFKPLFLRFDEGLLYPYIGNILDQKVFNLLCYWGSQFIKLKQIRNSIPKKIHGADVKKLADLKAEFEACIERSILNYSQGAERLVFGLSVYDDTVFSSLYLASLIKRKNRTAPVILGGDAITIPKGMELVKKLNWIDGAVVGYGEEVMKQVMVGYDEDLHPGEMKIERMINKMSLLCIQSLSSGPLLPSSYRNHPEHLPMGLVEIDDRGRLHVLPQRGCEWGRCAFCTSIDKKYHFHMDEGHLQKEIIKKIEMIKSLDKELAKIDVVIDSDSNEPRSVIPVLEALRANDDRIDFHVFWWMRIAQIGREFLSYLYSLKDSSIRIHVECGIESLNPTSLQNMAKGTDPLMVLEKIKAIQDIGGLVGGNYFHFFPLENVDDVKTEVDYLSKSLHLLCSPKASINCSVTYIPNDRDLIFHNQEKYRVVVRPTVDFFLKHIFNLDLPWNMNAVKYSLKYPRSIRNTIVTLYFRLFNDIFDYRSRKVLIEHDYSYDSFIRKLRRLPNVTLIKLARRFRYRAWLGLQILTRNTSYYQRTELLTWWAQVEHIKRYGRDDSILFEAGDGARSRGDEGHEFDLKNKTLSKRYDGPVPSNWSLDLSLAELDILRYLYWRRSYQNVLVHFKDKYSKEDVVNILYQHIILGSIICYKDILLSVFNDSEYFESDWKE